VKVVSKLVELDFEVHRIESSKNGIVVMNDPAVSMGTKVYITPADAMTIAGALLRSGAAWRFMLTFPFVHLYNSLKKTDPKQRKRT
jgi:hypothetical protein